MTQRIAIIGTAGRRDDGPRLTRPVWDEMVRHAGAAIDKMRAETGEEIVLVSGGAAYADHLAVRLYLDGKADGLELHLPAGLRADGFVERPGQDRMDPGRIANYYHRQFRERTGVDGLAELKAAADKGAVLDAGTPGFKERNTVVARKADQLIAYTFGPGREIQAVEDSAEDGYGDHKAAGVKDGGTADTWTKASNARRKIHVPIGVLEARAQRRQQSHGNPEATRQPAAQADAQRANQPTRTPSGAAAAPALEATMYFSFGRNRRAGVESETTFDAILAGERTSTTRFDAWRGTDRWRRLKPGQIVRFFEDKEKKGRAVDVTVREIREVDLANAGARELEAWSQAEGWTPQAGRDFGAKNGRGVQVVYDSPQLVPGRTPVNRTAQRAPSQRSAAQRDDNTRTTPAQGRLDLDDSLPEEAFSNAPAYGQPDAIRGFQGDHRWMSNFAPVQVTLDGETYPTVEHAYQAAKTLDPDERAGIRALSAPGQAKRAGKQLTMRPDWDQVKDTVMAQLQDQKYADPAYRAKLLATGEREIYEENGWGDRYWGVDAQGRGENRMGELLMAERAAWRAREAGDFVELPGERIALNAAEDDYLATPGERAASDDRPAYPGPAVENEKGANSPRADAPATSSLTEPAHDAAPTLMPNPVSEEQTQMSDQTQTAAGERLDEARDRLHLEGLGDHALSVVESAADGALDAQLKQDGRLEPLRTQLATLSATVNEATLAADGSRRPVRDLDTAQLEDISQELMNTLEESSEPGIPARIHAADSGRDMLARLNNAEAALQAFDYTTPQNPEMIEFAGIDTQTRRVSREQLERTTRQSLEFLERSHIMGVDFAQSPVAAEHHVLLDNLDAAGYLLPGESAARNEPLSQQKIRGSDAQLLSIANAASGLAMELDQDTLAKLPIEEGSSRFGGLSRIALGDEANRLKSTLTAAGYVADAHQPVDSEALAPAVVVDTRDYTFSIVQRDRIVDLPKGADEAAMRDHLMINYSDDKLLAVLNHVPVQAHTHGEAVEALHTHLADSALKRDQVVVLGSGNQELPLGAFDQVETALAEGRDPDAVMPRAERGRAGLTDRQANAMADLLETGVKVTGEAQFDTDDHNKVRFSAALLDQIRKAENDVKVTRADDAIMRIAREEVASASIKPEGARDIYEAATAIGDVSDFAAKVSKADAVVDQKKMDSAIYAVDVALQSGAANAVSGLAKRDAINRNAMEGFGAGSQTSVIDGLAQGHTPAPDSNEQLRSLNGAKPEMTAAYYRTLPASEQKRCRAYVMEPGKGFFDNYHTVSASFCAEVPRYRVNRLRAYIRDKMVNQDGAPNHRNLSVLASLSMDDRGRKGAFPGRAIVAPHLDEAKVIRQESERAGAILDAERQRQQQQFREQLPKATVSFERDQLAGLVRKLEASGSEVPVTLVKRDDRLSLEHPEAPTAASQPSTDEAVHKMRDGYRLTKVSADQLSQAVQSTPEGRAVQMHLEADRVSAMGPVQPAQKKRAVAAKSDEDMAI